MDCKIFIAYIYIAEVPREENKINKVALFLVMKKCTTTWNLLNELNF